MRLPFTKMQGAGNDFVVLDALQSPVDLTPEQVLRLADRRLGIGADQVLVVEPARTPGIDFGYRIYNHSGDEVEHCGNGARCFVRYVHDRGLTRKTTIKVETVNNVLELRLQPDGRVSVDMNRPRFDLASLPFDASGLQPRQVGDFALWPLHGVELALVSMGNPHAVQRVANVDAAPVATLGPTIERDPRFARGVNAGFMQVLTRDAVRLRVWARGAGETLACGTGACAAVVAGIRLGWLDRSVTVHARGGDLLIDWQAADPAPAADHDRAPEVAQPGLQANEQPVLMTGPAVTVFHGEIEL